MANNTVHIIDATTLIAVRNIASGANDPRFFNALLPPGQLVLTSTVWAEAAGKPNEYVGDKLLNDWLTQQRESGRLVVKNTDYIPPGTRNAGDDSIRDIVPLYKDSKTYVFVITDDAGLTVNSGGATRVLSTNTHVVENLVNGSITPTEYINTATGLAAQGNTKNLFFPGQVYQGANGAKIEMQAQGVLVTDSAGNKHFFTPNEKFKIDEQGNVRRSGDRSEAEYELLPVSEPTEGVLDGMPGLAEQFEKFIASDGQHYLVVPKDATLTHADGTVTLLTDFVNMVQEGTQALVGAIGSTLQSVPSYLSAIAPNVIADLVMGGDLEEVAERYAKIVGVTQDWIRIDFPESVGLASLTLTPNHRVLTGHR